MDPLTDPMAIALDLTAQADALPPCVHQHVTAEELSLRRAAHLALCRTPEFQRHRQRMHARRPDADLREEWQRPSAELVHKLAAQRRPARRVVLVLPFGDRIRARHLMVGRAAPRFLATLGALVAAVLVTCTGCGGGGEGTESGGVPGYGNTVATGSQACSVVMYGDSILAGQNPAGPLAETPAKAIKRMRPAWTVEDKSIAGTSAMQAAAFFPSDPRTARVVVLEHGVNDLILGMSPVEALRSMADYAKSEGRAVVMTGLSQQERVDAVRWKAAADGIAAVAKAAGATYANWPAVTGKTVDGTHPDQAFSTALVEQLVDAIEQGGCK